MGCVESNIYFILTIAIAVTNGSTTHSMTTPLPLLLPPPQCEYPLFIYIKLIHCNDSVAVTQV